MKKIPENTNSQSNLGPECVASLKNVEILKGPHLKPNILRSIRNGGYEKPEIEFGLANLRPGDRVMEMGAGAGIVGSVFLKNIKNITLQSYEANPDLIEHITIIYDHNGLKKSAKVFNNIVVAGDDIPKSMDFDVRDNFLGSRLSAISSDGDSRTVSIATKHYKDITETFPHNVLVMDIEGGELEFLEKADLSRVELIMLELHPKVYGGKGREQVLSYLVDKGFTCDEATSFGQVVSFKKPERMKFEPDWTQIGSGRAPLTSYNLDPQKRLADEIISVDNAVLAKTPRSQGFQIVASVFDEDRNVVPEAICWMNHNRPATKTRGYPRANRIKPLPGTWVFGGRFHPHFGHFLSETMARLWALDHIDREIKGVLFFPTYNDHEKDAAMLFSQLSEIMDVSINYKICDEFYRVDELIIPSQGNGLGRLILSSPEMRDYVRRHLKRDTKADGAEKLYISRSGGFSKVGRTFLGEKILEAWLQDEGYTIFHPQDHSWSDQLRHYNAATHILGPDGSPFHLINFTGRSDLNVGVIQRRPGHDAKQMVRQGQLYGMENISHLPHLERLWGSAGDHRAGLSLISEIDFVTLCEDLKRLGFISRNAKWKNLTDKELKKRLQTIAENAQADQRPVQSAHDSLTEFPKCIVEGQPQVFLNYD
ncbi:MAG: FkbM family methyltransferase [Litoreibacter sp.]